MRHPGITTSSFTRTHLKTSGRALQVHIVHVLAQALIRRTAPSRLSTRTCTSGRMSHCKLLTQQNFRAACAFQKPFAEGLARVQGAFSRIAQLYVEASKHHLEAPWLQHLKPMPAALSRTKSTFSSRSRTEIRHWRSSRESIDVVVLIVCQRCCGDRNICLLRLIGSVLGFLGVWSLRCRAVGSDDGQRMWHLYQQKIKD